MTDSSLHFGHVGHVDALFKQIQAYFETEHEPGGGALRGPTRGDQALVVGIYGPWGAGKTTWLRALHERARGQARRGGAATILVPVWFSAWRFEREPHLIIPLLKTADVVIRTACEREGLDEPARDWLRGVHRMLGDIVVSLVAGTSFKAGFKDFASFEFKPATVIETFEKRRDQRELDAKPNDLRDYESLYYDLHGYLEALTGRRDPPGSALALTETESPAPPSRLDLLFLIDDLDRCMPENAIKVLESIKVFLEIPGCAFILAMDDMMIERGVLHRYRDYIMPLSTHGEPEMPLPLSGAEYLEKLVHLPIRVPKPSRQQLRAFIESEYRELLDSLSAHRREILDLFATCTPLNPRKVIRVVEAFRTRHELANDSRYQPALLARLVLIEMFAPELHRFGQTEHGRDYLWHLQRMRGQDPGELITRIDNQLQNLPVRDNAVDVRKVDALLAAREIARLTDALRLGRNDFDPRRAVDIDVELRAGPVLRYHQHLTAFEDESAAHDERISSLPAAPERAPEVIALPVAEPSASQPNLLEHQRFAALAVSDDPWDRARAREMLQGSLIPQTYRQALSELLATNRETIDLEWFEFFAPNLDIEGLGDLAQQSGVVARLMSNSERGHRRSDDLRRFLTAVFTTVNPAHLRKLHIVVFSRLLPSYEPIDLSKVILAHAFVRGLDFGNLTLPTEASAWAGLDLRDVEIRSNPTEFDKSLALVRRSLQPGLSLPKGAGAITSLLTHGGDHIVTGGADGVVRLWSDIGELLHQRFGHNHPIVALAGHDYQGTWSLDERGMILDPSGQLRVNLDRPVLDWAPLVLDADRFAAAVLTARELMLVVVEGDQVEHWTSWTHDVALRCVAVFGRYRSAVVAVGDEAGSLHILAHDETQLRIVAKGSSASYRSSHRAHDGPVACMSAPGYELFTADPKGRLRMWNISDNGLEPHETVFELHDSITALTTDTRSNHATDALLVGLGNGELHHIEFDRRHGTITQRLLGRHETAVRSLALLDAERFVCGGERSVSVWARFGREICVFPSISSTPICLRGAMFEIYTLDERGRLILWSANRIYRRATADQGITRLAVADEMMGSRRCFGLGRKVVHCYDDQLEVALELAGHVDVGAIWYEGGGMMGDENGRYVTGDANALRWWTHEGRVELEKAHGTSPVIGLARWPESGSEILSAHRDGELLVWNDRGQVQQRLPNRGRLRELIVSREGIVTVLTERGKIIWRVPHEPKHLGIEASHLIADQHHDMWALGLDRKIYKIDREGEVEEVAQTYQGRLTGIAALTDGSVVTSGADGTTWYWKDGAPIHIVACLGDQAVLSIDPVADWPISIRRDDRPWTTEWRGAKVRVPVDLELHQLLACITREESRIEDPHAPSFRVPLYAYESAYGDLWQWADQNDPRELQLRWPEPADARARLLRALFGHVPALLEQTKPQD